MQLQVNWGADIPAGSLRCSCRYSGNRYACRFTCICRFMNTDVGMTEMAVIAIIYVILVVRPEGKVWQARQSKVTSFFHK